jgi:hypothetical protein
MKSVIKLSIQTLIKSREDQTRQRIVVANHFVFYIRFVAPNCTHIVSLDTTRHAWYSVSRNRPLVSLDVLPPNVRGRAYPAPRADVAV